jgi:AcrR family transcriptional regulator
MDDDLTAVAAPPDRRARNRARTHRALVEAALELFSEEGFDAVSVERIADAAGVSPRTFFRYFPTKEDVVVADYEAEFDAWDEEVSDPHPGETILEIIRRGTKRVGADYAERAQHWDRFFSLVATEPALQQRLLASRALLLQRASASLARLLELPPDDPRPAALAGAAMAATDTAVRSWYASGQAQPRAAVIDGALDGLTELGDLLAVMPTA